MANNPDLKKCVIPLVSMHCSNYSNKNVVKQANILLKNCPDDRTRKKFENKEIVLALRQPKNILRELTSAKFDSHEIPEKTNGIHKCPRPNCKICQLYLVECKEFPVSNNTIWKVPTHITCHSKYVIYYQICTECGVVSNIGKTNNLRARTNVHITSCRHGNTTDKFDSHVFNCKKKDIEPYFKLYIMIEVNDIDKLLVYEDYFHKRGMDTLNRNKAKD